VIVDALFVEGTNIEERPGIVVSDYSGLLTPSRRRGENVEIPYRHGEILIPNKTFSAYEFEVPITLMELTPLGAIPAGVGPKRAQMFDNLKWLHLLLTSGSGVMVLTRRLTTATGYEDSVCDGEYLDGLMPERVNTHIGRAVLRFKNLNGYWRDDTTGARVLP
jgi:hypothetical protein